MEQWGPDWIIMTIRGHAARNDMGGVISMLHNELYKPEYGFEAIGIATSRQHEAIMMEILSFKNTFAIYKERRSPFMVCTRLEALLKEYTPLL
jgi:hypothetical protein